MPEVKLFGVGKAKYTIVKYLFGEKEASEYQAKLLDGESSQKCLPAPIISMELAISEEEKRAEILPSYLQVELEERRQESKNLGDCVKQALLQADTFSDEEMSDEEITLDFFARWRREAKVISDSDLQCLWGKILAEELKSPSSVSFRTLDVVKNITKYEAELFGEVMRFAVNGKALIAAIKYGNFGDTSKLLGQLLQLENCGLVVGTGSELYLDSAFSVDTPNRGRGFYFNGYGVFSKNPDEEFRIKVIPLTPVGYELYKMADIEPFPKKYLKNLIESRFEKNGGRGGAVDVYLCENLSDGGYREIVFADSSGESKVSN